MKKRPVLTAVFSVATAVLILTLSISLPIYCRPFYYAHIDAFNLEEKSGETREEIKEAYDSVLDYLTLPGKEFSTGVFIHSEDGAAHFKDCKSLFTLNFAALTLSFVSVTLLAVLERLKKLRLCRPLGLHPAALGAGGLLAVLIPLTALVLTNPTNAFFAFHEVFFKGKENWIFSEISDPIITVLPLEFFLNCAALIGGSILTISLSTLIIGIVKKYRNK